MAIYKRKVKPKQVVIIDADIFASTIAPLLITANQCKTQEIFASKDWQPSASLQAFIDSKLQENIDHEFEANQFCDYHISKGSTLPISTEHTETGVVTQLSSDKKKQSSQQTARSKQSRSGGQESNSFSGIVDGLSSD